MSKQKQPRIGKEKRVIPLRAAGEKIVAAEDRPSKLLFTQVKKELELEHELAQAKQTKPSPDQYQTQTSTKPRPARTSLLDSKSSTLIAQPVAPIKDFNKRANSIERIALPLGMLPGASKAIYDALYLRTVGAIDPRREVQATRKQLMEWSGIKNIKTVNSNLNKLRETNLIEIRSLKGEQSGSVYVVKLPEEALESNPDQTQPRPDPTQTKDRPNPNQKMDLDQTQKMVWVGLGKTIENKATYEAPKTILKTKRENDDDEAEQRFAPLAGLLKTFEEVFKELTGKGIDNSDSAALQEIAELLADELRAARLHTKAISKPAAFLVAHLRARLSAPERAVKPVTRAKPDTVGKAEDKPIDLSSYTAEELAEFEKEFCLTCGKAHDECECPK